MFDQIMQTSGWPSLVQTFGRSVNYVRYGENAQTITAIWNPTQIMPGYYPDGEQNLELGVLRVSSGDISDPDTRDSVILDGVTWSVKSINQRGAIFEMQLEKREQRKVGGESERIQR
jgi:hypothetical protein